MSTPAALPLSPYDRDIAIRTILGEAGDQGQAGQAAVANVIRNRHAAGFADSASGVALQKGQFEPWMTEAGRARLQAIDPSSPAYRQAGETLDNVYSGQYADPTNGATHFYAPALQSALGRKDPSWTDNYQHTATIGGHAFYQDPQYASVLGSGGNAPALPASQPTAQQTAFQAAFGSTPVQQPAAQGAQGAIPQSFLLSMLQPTQQPAQGFPWPGSAAAANQQNSGNANLLRTLAQGGQQRNLLAALQQNSPSMGTVQ